MNKIKGLIKNNIKVIISFIFGFIIFSAIGVIAYTINSKNVLYTPNDNTWDVNNVKDAIDDIKERGTIRKVCKLVSGNALSIGSKYECNPSLDGTTKYNFFVLKVSNDTVKLIMERNISDYVGNTRKMVWQDGLNFFRTGPGKSLNWKVNVDLPEAQDIADATGYTNWNIAERDYNNGRFCLASKSTPTPWCNNQSAYNFLFDYTRECNVANCSHSLDSSYAYSYFTRDIIINSNNTIWRVDRVGGLVADGTDSLSSGIRPVITIYKYNIE